MGSLLPRLRCSPATLPQLLSWCSALGSGNCQGDGLGQRQRGHTRPFLQASVGRAPREQGRGQRGTHRRGPSWGEECTGPGEGNGRPLRGRRAWGLHKAGLCVP